jgi:hypothetical protein
MSLVSNVLVFPCTVFNRTSHFCTWVPVSPKIGTKWEVGMKTTQYTGFIFKKGTKLVFSPNKFVLPPVLDLPSFCCPLVFIKIKTCQNESLQIFWSYKQFRSLLRDTLPKLGMKQGLKGQELRSKWPLLVSLRFPLSVLGVLLGPSLE